MDNELLKQNFKEAVKFLKDNRLNIGITEDCLDYEYDMDIRDETLITIYPNDEDETEFISVKDFINIYKSLNEYTIDEEGTIWGENKVFFLLDAINNKTLFNLDNLLKSFKLNLILEDKSYNFKFMDPYDPIYLILSCKEGIIYDRRNIILNITSNLAIERNVINKLLNALIFELFSSYNLKLEKYFFCYKEDEEESKINFDKISSLLTNNGTDAAIQIYNKAISVDDIDYKILCFVKVLEYIAPTVVKEALNEDVIQKLSSLEKSSLNAKYVSELQALFKKYNKYDEKDSELIRFTIFKVVNFDEIKDILPKFICGNFKSIENRKNEILGNLAKTISNTRNQIAHAKANYQMKGNECPEEEKEKLIEILTIIARQCIRWFDRQPDYKKVL